MRVDKGLVEAADAHASADRGTGRVAADAAGARPVVGGHRAGGIVEQAEQRAQVADDDPIIRVPGQRGAR